MSQIYLYLFYSLFYYEASLSLKWLTNYSNNYLSLSDEGFFDCNTYRNYFLTLYYFYKNFLDIFLNDKLSSTSKKCRQARNYLLIFLPFYFNIVERYSFIYYTFLLLIFLIQPFGDFQIFLISNFQKLSNIFLAYMSSYLSKFLKNFAKNLSYFLTIYNSYA